MSTRKQVADAPAITMEIDDDRRAEVERLVRQLARVLAVEMHTTTCSVSMVRGDLKSITYSFSDDAVPSVTVGERPTRLLAMTEEFDALLARMQSPGARDRMQTAFDADPAELGEAAVNAARRHG